MDASQSISHRSVPINETSRLKPLYISAIVAGTAAIALTILFAVRPDLMGSLSSIAHKAIPISLGVGGGILIAAGSAGLVFSRRPKMPHSLNPKETDERVTRWIELAGRTSYGDKSAMINAFSRLSMDDIEELDTLLKSIDSHIKGFKNHSNIPDSPFNIYKTTDGHWNILYLNQKVLQKSPISTDQLYSLVAGMLQNNLYSTVSFQYYAKSPSVAFTELMKPNPLTYREFNHGDLSYPIMNASPST